MLRESQRKGVALRAGLCFVRAEALTFRRLGRRVSRLLLLSFVPICREFSEYVMNLFSNRLHPHCLP